MEIPLAFTAHGCKDQAQENPPEEEEQEEENASDPPADCEELQENEDIIRQVSLSPHPGHG